MGIGEIKERINSIQQHKGLSIRTFCSFNRIFDQEYERQKAILIALRHRYKHNSNLFRVQPTGRLFRKGFSLWQEIKEQETKLRRLYKTRHQRLEQFKEYRAVYRIMKRLVRMNEVRVLKKLPYESKSVLFVPTEQK